MSISEAEELIAGGLLILGLAIAAVKSRSIDVPGASLGALISFAAFLAGGVEWLIVIVAFFGVSSLLTRFRYDYKRKLGSAQEKGGERSWPNTIANGGVAGLAALAELATHREIYIVAFLGSVAAAMSDTIATEVGLLSRSKPRLITNLKKFVEAGTSGGISLLGEVAGIGSALGIAAIGICLGIITGPFKEILSGAVAITLGGVIAMNFDSILGGTVQGQNRCQICGAKTESRMHHKEKTTPWGGFRHLDNNGVNLVATLFGAIIAVVIFLALGGIP